MAPVGVSNRKVAKRCLRQVASMRQLCRKEHGRSAVHAGQNIGVLYVYVGVAAVGLAAARELLRAWLLQTRLLRAWLL